MELTEITTLIGSYGFPIICCLIMMFKDTKKDDKMAETVSQLAKVVEQNTISTNQAVLQLTNLVQQFNTLLSGLTALIPHKDGE